MRLTCLKYADTFLHERQIFCRGAEDRYRPIILTFFLIETDDGRRILADTGCDWLPGFVMRRFRRPSDVLQDAGASPESVTDVILTHAHLDHAGCAGSYPEAVFHIQRDELAGTRAFLPDGANVRPFEQTADVAPGVRAIRIGGHTRGSSVVELRGEGVPLILGGDECYLHDCFRRGIPTGSSVCPEKSARFLEEYGASGCRVVLFHDPAAAPGEPGAYRIE